MYDEQFYNGPEPMDNAYSIAELNSLLEYACRLMLKNNVVWDFGCPLDKWYQQSEYAKEQQRIAKREESRILKGKIENLISRPLRSLTEEERNFLRNHNVI